MIESDFHSCKVRTLSACVECQKDEAKQQEEGSRSVAHEDISS